MAKITLKGNPVNTSGNLPLKGTQAPDFALDEKGKVVYNQLVPEITQEPDYEAALAAL